MAYITFQEDIPLEQRRGVDCLHNLNQRMLLLKSPADAITEAISEMYQIFSFERDAYGLTLRIVGMPCVIYQFRSHSWGIVEILRCAYSFNDEDLLRSLSRRLNVDGILFEQSDSANFIKYCFFNSGELLELFEFQGGDPMGKDCTQELFNSKDVYTLEFSTFTKEYEDELRDSGITPPSVTCRFKSCLRHLNIEEIGEPFKFVDKFFQEQNLYTPGIRWTTEILDQDNLVLRFQGLSSNDFERLSALMLLEGV